MPRVLPPPPLTLCHPPRCLLLNQWLISTKDGKWQMSEREWEEYQGSSSIFPYPVSHTDFQYCMTLLLFVNRDVLKLMTGTKTVHEVQQIRREYYVSPVWVLQKDKSLVQLHPHLLAFNNGVVVGDGDPGFLVVTVTSRWDFVSKMLIRANQISEPQIPLQQSNKSAFWR